MSEPPQDEHGNGTVDASGNGAADVSGNGADHSEDETQPTLPPSDRRTVRIGEGTAGAVPGSGGAPPDPLLMPHPVYHMPEPQEPAEGELSEGRVGTIVIDAEDDLPEAIYTVQEARSPDDPGTTGPRVDPRMKARRLAVSQARGRRRFWWVIAFVVVLLLGLGALAVFSSSVFDIERVRVTGAVNSDPTQVSEITDDLLGKAILTADLTAIADRLEKLPWVKYAQVKMDFPHTVVVQLAERTPVVAFQSSDSRWRVIDVDGRVIDVLAGRPIDYTAVFGPGPDNIAGETAPQYAKIAQFTTAIPPMLRQRVQHFTVDDQMDVTMTLNLTEDLTLRDERKFTQVDLCAADELDVEQLVALTAFIETKVLGDKTPPLRITACQQDLVTTSNP